MTYVLYVRPVSHVSKETLYRTFSRYGEVTDVYIPVDFKTQKRRDFAYIKFNTKYSASKAIEELNQTEVNGKEIFVEMSKEVRKTPEEMRALKEARAKDKEERPGEDKVNKEEEIKQEKKEEKNLEFHKRYFTACDYPPGVGEEFIPLFQRGLKPPGQRKMFYSWVYVPEEKIKRILEIEGLKRGENVQSEEKTEEK